jgi:pyridoxine/pyridoxamine 5'-phosphate oxidase
MTDEIETTDGKNATDSGVQNERVVMCRWHGLIGLSVLTTCGDRLGRQIATVFEEGVWIVWDAVDNDLRVESGKEISVHAAKAMASLAAINRGLLDT